MCLWIYCCGIAAHIWAITRMSSLRFSCSGCARTLPFKRLARIWRRITDLMTSLRYLIAFMFHWMVTLGCFVCMKTLERVLLCLFSTTSSSSSSSSPSPSPSPSPSSSSSSPKRRFLRVKAQERLLRYRSIKRLCRGHWMRTSCDVSISPHVHNGDGTRFRLWRSKLRELQPILRRVW